jgi:hypothetical protein
LKGCFLLVNAGIVRSVDASERAPQFALLDREFLRSGIEVKAKPVWKRKKGISEIVPRRTPSEVEPQMSVTQQRHVFELKSLDPLDSFLGVNKDRRFHLEIHAS